jgi:hypothetical protein
MANLTGPPYPASPGAGSNGIGVLEIGESQIGDIVPFDWRATIISQYANSNNLTQLIENFDAYIDQTENISQFYDLVMNLDTAQGYGLDVWGRIVGVQRVLNVVVSDWFGFSEAVPGADPFGQGAFWNGEPLTSNYALADDSYRTLIIAKAMANITNGSIPAINQILLALFPNRGNCYVTEGNGQAGYFGFQESSDALPFNQAPFYNGEMLTLMTMAYVFNFQLTPVELAIVEQSGVLPKPTGVKASVVIL